MKFINLFFSAFLVIFFPLFGMRTVETPKLTTTLENNKYLTKAFDSQNNYLGYVEFGQSHNPQNGYIFDLKVFSPFRGNGVGSLLLRNGYKELKNQNYPEVYWEAEPESSAHYNSLIQFYKNNGGEVVSTYDCYGLPCAYMKHSLINKK